MSSDNEKEVLKAYEEYLAYFLNNDMDGVNSEKGHVISSGTRIRKDKSVIEKYTAFYAFTKTDKGWKMYAVSSVILV